MYRPVNANAYEAITSQELNTEISREESNSELTIESKIEEIEKINNSEFEHTTDTTDIKSLVWLFDANKPKPKILRGWNRKKLEFHVVRLVSRLHALHYLKLGNEA